MLGPELKTFVIAMSPIVEMRGSIPIALKIYHLPVWSAYLFSVLGNLVPLILIIRLLEPIYQFISRYADNENHQYLPRLASRAFYLTNRIIEWVFLRTRNSHQSQFERYGRDLAVIILVATPIPLIGGWTGAICAFVFGMSFKQALPFVILGALLGGVIVTLLSLGLFNFFNII